MGLVCRFTTALKSCHKSRLLLSEDFVFFLYSVQSDFEVLECGLNDIRLWLNYIHVAFTDGVVREDDIMRATTENVLSRSQK